MQEAKVRNFKYLNIFLIFPLLGCSGGNNQNPTVASPGVVDVGAIAGAGAGILVAGCNFSDRDQNYAFDIVVSGLDNVGQGQKLRAAIYDRSGSIQGVFSVEVLPGATGSTLLETIQSADDGGTSFKIEISNTVSTQSPPTYASNLVHAHLSDGSQISNRGLLCSAGH
jgi:hypothetical protein